MSDEEAADDLSVPSDDDDVADDSDDDDADDSPDVSLLEGAAAGDNKALAETLLQNSEPPALMPAGFSGRSSVAYS